MCTNPQLPRRRIVGVSFKMYFSIQQTRSYIQACTLLDELASSRSVDLFLIPDFLSITTASHLLENSPTIRLGAQNCCWTDGGAYTGEVSPASLKSLSVSIVELGHAERRKLFRETDETVVKKAIAVERNGMTPLVCVGERVRGSVQAAIEECRSQVESVLAATSKEVIFAYEPVWAIGQQESASADHVVDVVRGIRALCGMREVRIIYGGSAKPGTFAPLGEVVDGLFLGRFAHDIKNLEKIISEVAL